MQATVIKTRDRLVGLSAAGVVALNEPLAVNSRLVVNPFAEMILP